MPQQRKNKEYYALITGHIKEPTIFSSWGHAHPRMTRCSSLNKSYRTLQEARNYMESMCVAKPKEIIKSEAEKTTPLDGNGFYAVANGANPGIYPFYHGEKGAEREVTEEEGSCHKRFRTRAQAEAFIEDWKESYAEIWYELIKETLDEGFRPRNIGAFRSREMRSIIEQFLYKPSISTDVDDIAEKTAKQLSLQDNKQKK